MLEILRSVGGGNELARVRVDEYSDEREGQSHEVDGGAALVEEAGPQQDHEERGEAADDLHLGEGDDLESGVGSDGSRVANEGAEAEQTAVLEVVVVNLEAEGEEEPD